MGLQMIKTKKLLAGISCLVAWTGTGVVATAQEGPPASPVRYTEAREHPVRQSLRLPGTVEAPNLSPVATEVEGLVVELLAREGSHVARGEPLAQLRTTNLKLRLRSARGQLKEAQARLDWAEGELDRARGLLEQDLISDGDFDQARADFRAWEGRVEQLTADIERIKTDLDRCTIRSPIAGVVVAEHIDVGAWIDMGDPVLDVLATDELEVRVEVPERYFPMVTDEVEVLVHPAASPELDITGRVSAVIPLANTGSRVFPIKVSIPGQEGRLAPGMLVHVSLPLGEPRNSTIVPKDAIVAQGPGRFVFLIGEDGTVQQLPVETGTGLGAWIVVAGSLQPGQKIVTRGNERLFPGQAVLGEPLAYELP
jgi:membrane fusion protein (multidrug efflux system)